MAANLQSKTARAKLSPRRDPYWVTLTRGVHLGYRTGAGDAGTWIGRRRGDDGRYQFKSLGSAATLEYDDARKAVTKWDEELASGVVHSKDMTVADVCRLYIEHLRVEKGAKASYDAEKRFLRYVYPETCQLEQGAILPNGRKKRLPAFVYTGQIGPIKFNKLRPVDVKRWRDAQVTDDSSEDEESIKAANRAKDSINRNLNSLKAAFNFGKDVLGLVSTDSGWKTINVFRGVGARREGYLNKEQRQKILAAMPGELRQFATALLLIGARPGELANANVNDFDRNSGTLALDGKTGPRTVTLSTQAVEFFAAQTKDRIGKSPLLVMANGERWTTPRWAEQFREAREQAGMPGFVMYHMRHTYISEAIAQGLNIHAVAQQTGTSVKIIEEHYCKKTEDLVERLNRIAII